MLNPLNPLNPVNSCNKKNPILPSLGLPDEDGVGNMQESGMFFQAILAAGRFESYASGGITFQSTR